VEGHIRGRLAVDLAFGDRDALEDGKRVLFDEMGKLAGSDEFPDFRVAAAMLVVVMMMMVVLVRVDFGAVIVIVLFLFLVVVMAVLSVLVGVRMLRLVMMMLVPVIMIVIMVFVGVRVLVAVAVVMPAALVAFILIVRVGFAFVDAKFHAFDLLPLLAVEVHVKRTQIELRKLPFKRGRFDTEIDERADRHVATDAGEAIEKKDLHEI
jgi:hypothetical protein